jgi:transcription initiation factor TFIIB
MNDHQQAEVAGLTDALDAPETVHEMAHALAYRAFVAELHMGRSVEVVAASAVYAAFRRDGESRTLDEVSAEADVDRTKLGRTYKCFADELDITLEPPNPHEFVERFADSLDMEDRTEARAHEIVTKSAEAGLHSGIKLAGVAAAAVYHADRGRHGRFTQREVAAVAGVSAVTIRNRLHEQAHVLDSDEHGKIPPSRWQHLDTD